ncbi:GEVED domain-containing protein [Phaeobacter sp. J2-8]|uniref:GEVED domain-containing protein n=1 Tax=Phaeobacter sp. J2-8 TaxID=2931394 RepID=UPI001FD5BF4A|nr:GEVED domain-containing protein [Phaeobacter sp. J2-8]MCJ7873961.1 GEVED domain-containing protein [Phaeobacter sp. J2-8]
MALATAVLTSAFAYEAQAGDFGIDWSTFDWPEGTQGPLVRTLRDQYGFEIDTTIEITGLTRSFFDGTRIHDTPDDLGFFGGNVKSLVIVSDARSGETRRGESRITARVEASSGGIAVAVDNLEIDILDIDSTDNNNSGDRCDFVTAFGDNGNPTMTTIGSSPTVVVGPGAGSGSTGPLLANEAQCLFIDSPFVTSPTSNNNNNGTVRAIYPDNTSAIEIWYDESIGEVRDYPSSTSNNPGARGIGLFGEVVFTTDQSITLARNTTPPTALQGESITFVYTVTNNGELPFNTGQDVVIEDDLVGTVTCPSIDAPLAPGGTVTCTASYTVTAADVLTGAIDSTATAGMGSIGQPFVSRLQSNPENASIVTNVLSNTTGPQTCTPQSVFSQPRTQLAGSGSETVLTTSDIFVFDNVTNDINGNDVDVVFQLTSINDATDVNLNTSLEARMVAADNGYLTYLMRLVQDGTATPANPLGIPVEQSRINGVIIQQTDVDSSNVGQDTSDVVGPLLAPDAISHFNTVPLAGFPSGGQAISMDPAKTGDPTNWLDEPNESNFDNYATYEYSTFVEAEFIHGFTGTYTNSARRGSSILLCAVTNVSPSVVAQDDDYTASPLNTLLGGTAGEVLSNDTINGLPATFPTATIEVLTPAISQTAGDPVPVLETAGADAGRVIVPPNVPAGVYEIEYELCDSVDPTQCDRAKVRVAVFDGLGVDFGDAPVTYLPASHGVALGTSLYLGAIPPDIEAISQSDATATADDLLGTDDEDAVIFPVLTQGVISTVDVPVVGAGYLQAWLDFNGDGLFEDTLDERIASDFQDDGTGADNVAGDGVIQIDVAVPSDATTSTTYARFRYSSLIGTPVTGFAIDGEVEDYSLIIAAADLVDRGDAPASYGDPRHVVVPSIYLGSGLPDTETDPQNSVLADADDLAGFDDEDSIATFPVLEAGTTVPLTVQTHETLSLQLPLGIPVVSGITNLQVWIDWDQSGTFEPSEQVATDYRDGGVGDTDGSFNNQISLDIAVPTTITSGFTYARVRWSTSSALTSDPFDGLNFDGEVEDYRVTLSNPSGPLQCSDTFYMIATETSSNLPTLSELLITESAGTYTLSQDLLPPDYTGNYLVTGWGFNELDGFIYGVRQSPRSLMRINAGGQVREVADLSSLGLESPDASSDILPNGVMVYMVGGNFGRYQLLDISDPSNPVNLGVLETGQNSIYGRDIAYNPRDGLMYFIDPNRDVYTFDPLGGTPGSTSINLVGNVPLPAGIFSINSDSVWFDGSGFLYAFDNQSRQVFAVEVGEEGNRPASFSFIEVEGPVSDLTYQGNDGASCRAPGPFVSTVFVEGSIAGTLYEDTNDNGTRDAGEPTLPAGITVQLYDDNGTPADISDDIFSGNAETAADGSYVFAQVDATRTWRIEVDQADPDIPAGHVVSTTNPITGVTVTQGVETSDQDFGFRVGTPQADLSLTKAAFDSSGTPIGLAMDGSDVDFVLRVTNDGPAPATGVQVRDLIPSGFSYVSDDAAAQGDSYDSGTGVWVVGDVANGATETLTIRVTMNAAGDHTNAAEIIASDQADPDSDPATGALTDDLGDGVADDDEASATVVLDGTGATLSGVVFLDHGGVGGTGTAYDGVQDANEPGTGAAKIEIFDSTGTLVGSPVVAADGAWSLTLPEGFSDQVTVTVTPSTGYWVVSEDPRSPPGLVNADPLDGSYSFQPGQGADYTDLRFGLIKGARLSESQQAATRAGQVVALRHDYIADAQGTVQFSTAVIGQTAPGLFAVALFYDTACDGTPVTAVSGPVAVTAGMRICLVARVTASAAAAPGSSIAFDLVADTSYGVTGLTEQLRNSDVVRVEGSDGRLQLRKTVRNITQGTPEGVSNGATLGDVLEYRIYLENPGNLPAAEIVIHDRTPPYTSLAGAVPSPVNVGADVVCTLAEPASNTAGYAGSLRWECTGTHAPGATGSVAFQVAISP